MYQKFASWITAEQASNLKKRLVECGFSYSEAKKVVCAPLSKRVHFGFVSPEAWQKSKLCKRQLSWYWKSSKAGWYLFISSEAVENFGLDTHIILRSSSFRPPQLPDESKKKAMIDSLPYRRSKPAEWDDLSQEDPRDLDKWMKTMGIRGMRFEDLFLTHCANHANFIEPVYYIQDDQRIIPYSIASTKFVCSACLEFFNIIGESFDKKFVIPCPGAVIFAGLPVNKYVEVETHYER